MTSSDRCTAQPQCQSGSPGESQCKLNARQTVSGNQSEENKQKQNNIHHPETHNSEPSTSASGCLLSSKNVDVRPCGVFEAHLMFNTTVQRPVTNWGTAPGKKADRLKMTQMFVPLKDCKPHMAYQICRGQKDFFFIRLINDPIDFSHRQTF